MSRLVRTDYHIHTYLSGCGDPAATFGAVLQAGLAAELEAIGISDHIFYPRHRERPLIARRELPSEVEGMRVLVGCEADMQSPARASIDAEFAARLDYVMISASHLYDPGVEREFVETPASMAAYMLDLMHGAIRLGYADIIVHPFHVPAHSFSFSNFVAELHEGQVRALARAAAAAGVALECNPKFPKAFPDASRRLFPVLLEEGCKLAVNSDAHHPRGIGCRGPEFATEDELRDIGIDEACLWRIEDRVTKALG